MRIWIEGWNHACNDVKDITSVSHDLANIMKQAILGPSKLSSNRLLLSCLLSKREVLM
jgi:hypothetical protein